MPEIPPVGRPQRVDNNPNKPKTPQERVEDTKKFIPADNVELSEIAKLNLELEKAKNELKFLPNSVFWQKRVWELDKRIAELQKQESQNK